MLFSIFGNMKTYLPFGQSPSVPVSLDWRAVAQKTGDWMSVVSY